MRWSSLQPSVWLLADAVAVVLDYTMLTIVHFEEIDIGLVDIVAAIKLHAVYLLSIETFTFSWCVMLRANNTECHSVCM